MKILRRTRQRLKNYGWMHRNSVVGLFALLMAAAVGGFTVIANNNTPPTTLTTRVSSPVTEGDLLSGQWSFLPGARRETGGLRIHAMPFAIVKQDGSSGQANRPINLYGTHLTEASEFTVRVTLAEIKGAVGIQLYGQAPIIADEFRIEPKSIRLHIDGGTLSVSVWDGSKQEPVTTNTGSLTAPLSAHAQVQITRKDNAMQVRVNDGAVLSIADPGIFSEGIVRFGFDAERDSYKITNMNADGVNGKTFKIADSSTLRVSNPDPNGLQSLASKRRPDFMIGGAMALGPLATDRAYAQTALGGNFGALTPENAMKWQFTEPSRNVFDFRESDALVQLAQRHNMKVHGHTLVWGEANPRWVREVPATQLEQVMTNHITKVVSHFKGKMYSWDVVNEPFDDEEWVTLRPHLWYKAMGESYIPKAFHAARAADPNALLFINEYGLEEDGERWDNFLAMVSRLKQQGVPIDGVGFQSHIYERRDKVDANVLRRHIQQLAAIGVKARVSEIDVYSEDGTAVQAQQYSDVLSACLAEPNCVSWTTWGVSDRYNYFIDDDGSVQQGQDFLWSDTMAPTPAIDALRSAITR